MRHLAVLCILAWTGVTCLAQEPTLTAREAGMIPAPSLDGAAPGFMCYFGGEYDYRQAFTSERNTLVSESWTFDDLDWPGGTVTVAVMQFYDTGMGTPAGGDVIVYQGLGEGEFGRLIARATDVARLEVRPIGWESWVEMTLTLDDQSFSLPGGRYHLGIRPVGTGRGQAFAASTSGRFSVGGPLHNGNSYFQSDFFGYPVPTNWESIYGPGPWDVSYGLECGGDYSLNVVGSCAGNITISWDGARANERQAIIYSPGLGSAPIGGICGSIPSGLASVELFHPTFGTGPAGIGQVHGYVSWRACDKRIQLVTYTGGPCVTSNVVQIH